MATMTITLDQSEIRDILAAYVKAVYGGEPTRSEVTFSISQSNSSYTKNLDKAVIEIKNPAKAPKPIAEVIQELKPRIEI